MEAADICALIGQRIRVNRLKRKWTQSMLADHAALTREHISAIETGRAEPGLRALERIAIAMDTTVTGLLAGR